MFKSKILTLRVLIGISLLVFAGNTYSQFKYYSWDKAITAKSSNDLIPTRDVKEDASGSILITYTFPGYTVAEVEQNNQHFQMIQIKGFGYNFQTGAPAVPARTDKVALPANTEPVMTIVSADFAEVGSYSLPPAQEMQGDGDKIRPEYYIDNTLYAKSEFFPSEIATVADVQIMRGVPLAFLDIKPVQYNPVTGKVRIYKSFTVKISFKPSVNKTAIDAKSVSANQLLRNVVINTQTVDKYFPRDKSGTTLDKTGYIIVTTPEFSAAADTLAQWKRQLGCRVEVLSQATWTIAQVKAAVRERYLSWSPSPDYLLILGDQEDVPDYDYWNIYLTPNLHVYSTLYYVCMDGPTDYMPEMAHGRISVKSGTQALSVIQKIVNYEKNPPSDVSFYNKGLHACYFEDNETVDNTDDKRYAHTSIETRDYMQSLGYQCDRVYFTEPTKTPLHYNPAYSGDAVFPADHLKSNGFPWDGDKNDIINAVNDGRFYLFHRDHGLNYGWVNPHIDTADLNELHNGDKTPVVFSVNCGSGMFQMPEPAECFAEKFLRIENGGAIGVISATEETRSGFNDALIEGFMDAIWPSPGLYPNFGHTYTVSSHGPIYAMGDVMIQGLIRMTETWDETWATVDAFHLYHYFGDPAMQIWTAAPTAITAQHLGMLNVGATSLTITSSSCPDGIATLVYNNDLQVKIQLQSGTGTLTFPAALDNSVSEMVLTISKHNYIPYTAKIVVTSGPLANFTANYTSICPLSQVNFTDHSSSNPTSWLWSITPATYSFVNSTNQNSRNPVIQFTASGTYNISLTATNTYGSTTLVKSNYINVMNAPAKPVADDASFCDQGSALLTASGSTGQYKWWSLPTGGTLLGTSSSYTTPVVSQTTSYYVEGLKDQVNGSLTTTFASTSGTSGSMFNIRAFSTITVDSFAINILDMLPHTAEVYYKSGSYIGYENNASAWTLLGTYSVTGNGQDVPTILHAGELQMEVDQTYGIYITLTSGSMRYTNTTQTYTGSDISISDGAGINYPFGTIYSPRVWNGTVYYSKGQYRCNSIREQVQVIITPTPVSPTVNDAKKCFDDAIPELSASGSNVKWYSNPALSGLLHEGNRYTPINIEEGENLYYVTQSTGTCESDAKTTMLTSYPETVLPASEDLTLCEYNPVVLIAQGELIKWYADEQGLTLMAEDDTLILTEKEPGEFNFYVSNTQNGCESELIPIIVTVNSQPEKPISEDKQVCFGSTVVLEADGTGVKWYADDPKDFVIDTGNAFDLGQPAVGNYTYYVSQTLLNCESEQDTISLRVNANPVIDLGSDTTIYLGDILTLSCNDEGEYLWFDGSNDDSYSFISEDHGLGSYTAWLEYTDGNNCQATDSLVILVKNYVDIPTPEEEGYLMIYPNPTHGLLNVEFPQAQSETAKVTIMDTQGRVIYIQEYSETYASTSHQIDLSRLRKGIYILTVESTGLPQTVKIMVK